MSWRVWIDRSLPDGVVLPSGVELTDDVEQADAVVVGASQRWDVQSCEPLPRLKVVARSGIGYDNVAVADLAAMGVAACNAPDAPTVSTAEHTLALMLAVTKSIKGAERRLNAGLGDYRSAHRALELEGRTVGLLGCGRIGSRVATYCSALGMTVLVHDPHIEPSQIRSAGEPVSLDELWSRSDVISLHAPATAATRHVISSSSIAAMRSGVVIINCARGALIDQDALLAALDSGQVAGAGLDATEPEPLPAGHPLLGRDDVIITPHIASTTTVGSARLVGHALVEAVAWLRGGTPEHLLDDAAADPAVDRRINAADPGNVAHDDHAVSDARIGAPTRAQ